MEIREIHKNELELLLQLYTHLHNNPASAVTTKIQNLWEYIIKDKNHHIIVAAKDNILVASCVLIIVPNLTNFQRPYALIENVVTHEQYRKRGYASEVLSFARNIAVSENCYKIMLLTGSKKESTLRFYEKAGYNKEDKTAFIQWLK